MDKGNPKDKRTVKDNIKGKLAQIYLSSMNTREKIAKTILQTKTVNPVVILPVSEPVTKQFLKSGKHSKQGRTWQLKTGNKKITVAPGTIGAPALEIQVNALCAAGAKCFIRADFCGSLSSGLQVGDLFIADEARGEEGVSSLYSTDAKLVPDSQLLNKLRNVVEEQGIQEESGSKTRYGRIVTVDYFFAQTDETLIQWSESADAVDMETAALYAMSSHFEIPAISVMTVSDAKLQGVDIFTAEDFPFSRLFTGIKRLVDLTLSFIDRID